MKDNIKTEGFLYIVSLIENLKKDIRSIVQKIEIGKFHESQEIVKSSQEKMRFIEFIRKDYQLTLDEIDKVDLLISACESQIVYTEMIIKMYMRMMHMEDEIVLLRYGLDNIHMRLLIVCGEGVSSSFLVNRILKYADKGDVIQALPITMVRERIHDFDVVLVAPHLRHKEVIVQKICSLHNKAYGVIEASVYGKMDGVIILKQAKELYINMKKIVIKKNNDELY